MPKGTEGRIGGAPGSSRTGPDPDPDPAARCGLDGAPGISRTTSEPGAGGLSEYVMRKRDYSISTTLTGDSGENFLGTLTDAQRRQITGLIELQRQDLHEIVRVRRAIATELRRFLKGETSDRDKVLALSARYGELDGEMSCLYAVAFANVGKTLTAQQKQTLAGMRSANPSESKGPFLYSTPISMPRIENTDAFFGVRP